jgi:hypothetical protein
MHGGPFTDAHHYDYKYESGDQVEVGKEQDVTSMFFFTLN